MCLQGRTASLATEQLLPLFKSVKPILASADASLVNLETSIITKEIESIKKSGLVMGTDVRVLELIRQIGFTGVTLANNHFADYGGQGVRESLQLLDKYDIWYVGAGLNARDAESIKYIHIGQSKIAIINACEHEFTIATETAPGCNWLNPIHQYSAIKAARETSDYVIVITHGGHEHYNLPTQRMQELYRFFIDTGADAVINHHQHCFTGYEIYKECPIIYGIGNFFFDMLGQDENWNEGYMVKLIFDNKVSFELIPYRQNAAVLGIELMKGDDIKNFNKTIEKLNDIIQNPKELEHLFEEWAHKKAKEYLQILEPSVGRNIKRLNRFHLIPQNQQDHWIPRYLTEERRLMLKSIFQCESHQEIMNIILETKK